MAQIPLTDLLRHMTVVLPDNNSEARISLSEGYHLPYEGPQGWDGSNDQLQEGQKIAC